MFCRDAVKFKWVVLIEHIVNGMCSINYQRLHLGPLLKPLPSIPLKICPPGIVRPLKQPSFSRDESQEAYNFEKIPSLLSLEATEAKTKGDDKGEPGFVLSPDLET